jgi:hypothetical protein
MASGSGLATALAALKGHAVAAAVVSTLVLGGGAATAAVATGTVQVPGISAHQTGSNDATTQRAQACANNGDAARLAAIYAPMFGDGTADETTQAKTTTAQQYICTLFAGSGHRAYGLGEVQLLLETAAAIDNNGNACLTASSAHGQPTETGKPANPGHSGSAGTPAAGQPSATVPSANATDTEKLTGQVIDADAHGTPLAQVARNCGATPATGNPNGGTDQGQPTTTPGKPSETPGAKPTGTPGHP